MTEQVKFTPGPWEYRKNHNTSHTFEIIGSFNAKGEGMRLAEVFSGPTNHDSAGFVDMQEPAQGRANARLIAAVPDLLEAAKIGLKAVQALARQCSKDGKAIAELKFINDAGFISDAIAKATGKTSS